MTAHQQRVPLFTADEVKRVLRAGLIVYCQTPKGLVARVDDAEAVYTWAPERERISPDRAPGERVRVRALYPGGTGGFGHWQWCRPSHIWAQEP